MPPHLSLICSQCTYERGYKYISLLCSSAHWGALGNQAECRSAFYPGQQWQREDGTACTKRHMRWLWAGCGVPEVAWPSCALKQNHCKKIQNDGPIPCKPHVSHPPWCDPPVVWVSGVETSIKNMTIITDFVMGPEESDACGTAGSTAGSELVLHLGRKSNPAAFSSAVSVGEIWTGQEMMLLDYGASQGPRHFVLVGYRCSIDVSHRNHPSFPWLSTFFQQNLPKKQFRSPWSVWFCYFSVSLSLTLCSCLGLICACFGFKHKINSAKVS